MAGEVSFSRVLIANRGEIARRVQRGCAKLGLESVAIYSEADSDAPFVAEADHAICIGPAAPSESYLNIEAILAAAHKTGAGAIHPGYGFLSENAGFAERVKETGLVFIGPAPPAIARMGSKIEAKAAAKVAGVPVLPGYSGTDQSDERLLAEARALGTPLLVKASAGGGGRGMRRVTDLADAPDAIAAARAEAGSVFGDATVFLERFAPRARHVEVQVLGDTHGNVVHLWERDCSLQRNHQKLVEEAPAAALPAAIRAGMLHAAVSLARAIGYHSAGTVEFLYDPAREKYYFLEMNTRLQVEHPVTEAVTGIDLVEWQLRVARGERLAFAQDDIGCAGHAIELRIAAENPAENFRPETGRISLWQPPEGSGVRFDSGVELGSEVSHYYDSMLAKLIVHGSDRDEAIRKAVTALDGFVVGGVGLNLSFQRALITHPDFAAMVHHTAGLAEMFPGGWTAPAPDAQTIALATLALHLHLAGRGDDPWRSLGAWRVTDPAGRAGTARYWAAGDKEDAVTVAGQGVRLELHVEGSAPCIVDHARLAQGRLSGRIGGRSISLTAHVERANDVWRVHLSSYNGLLQVPLMTLEDRNLQPETGAAGGGEGTLAAPMPGVVAEVRASLGDEVSQGQTLLVLEAMKLLQSLPAPVAGIVDEVYCAPGDTVPMGARLIRIARKEE